MRGCGPIKREPQALGRQAAAIRRLNEWGGQPLPLNASAWWAGTLVVRLSGAAAGVRAAQAKIGGEVVEPAMASSFWAGLRDHRDEFFLGAKKAIDGGATLWRLSVPQVIGPLKLPGEQLLEWGGAQRWLCTPLPAARRRCTAWTAVDTPWRPRSNTLPSTATSPQLARAGTAPLWATHST